MKQVKDKANIWLAVGILLLTLLIFSLSWYSYTYNKTFDQLILFIPSGEWTENNLAFVETGLKVKSDAPLEEKLEKLAQTLSEAYDGLPIVFLGVENSFGDQIAVFDLRESYDIDENKEVNAEVNNASNRTNNQSNTEIGLGSEIILRSWQSLFDSGRSDLNLICTTLAQSLLQPDYTADWIDGVRILYEGERMPFYNAYSLFPTVYNVTTLELDQMALGERVDTLVLTSKVFDEDRKAIYYTLEGDFFVEANLINGSDFDEIWIEMMESPIMKYNLDIGFSWEDSAEIYIENFDYYFSIENKEALLERLKLEKPENYSKFLIGEKVPVKLQLRSFNSTLYYESEYYNVVEFVKFIE